MKFNILFIFMFLCFLHCQAQTVVVKDDSLAIYNDKKIRIREGKLKNGKPQGKWKLYNDIGSLIGLVAFNNGVEDGHAEYYNEITGIKFAEGEHKNGIRMGIWTFYFHNNGKLKSTETYTGMTLQGEAKYYDSLTLKLVSEGSYEKNKQDGLWQYYDSHTGRLVEAITFNNDMLQGNAVYYAENGRLLSEGKYYKDSLCGLWKYYDTETGYLLRTDEYNKCDGAFNGKSVVYDSVTGKKFLEIEYKDTMMHGAWKEYDPITEVIIYQAIYENDKKQGLAIYYQNNGKDTSLIGCFKDDEQHGEWKSYYGNNKLSHVQTYKKGIEHGSRIAYDSVTGGKIKESVYYNGKIVGSTKYYNAQSSKLIVEERFSDTDSLNSTLYVYDETGFVCRTLDFRDGKRNGKSVFYYEGTKNVWIDYTMKNDTLDGPFTIKYISGNVKRYEIYAAGKLVSSKCFSEDGTEIAYTPCITMPKFQEDVMTYIGNNLRYPENAKKMGIEGKAVVRFLIGENGKVYNAEVIKGFNKECDAEAERLVSQMPLWIPGEVDGRRYAIHQTLPIVFWIH